MNYSQENLNEADSALTRLYTALRDYPLTEQKLEQKTDYSNQFKSAMDDDFNTPAALSILFDLARAVNRNKTKPDVVRVLVAELRQLGQLLGILQQEAEQFLKKPIPSNKVVAQTHLKTNNIANPTLISENEINKRIDQRTDARNNKNWELADQIREELMQHGVILEDVSGKTTWRRE